MTFVVIIKKSKQFKIKNTNKNNKVKRIEFYNKLYEFK
jgi:hypothetical protein